MKFRGKLVTPVILTSTNPDILCELISEYDNIVDLQYSVTTENDLVHMKYSVILLIGKLKPFTPKMKG